MSLNPSTAIKKKKEKKRKEKSFSGWFLNPSYD
jgi:hypothetical protein